MRTSAALLVSEMSGLSPVCWGCVTTRCGELWGVRVHVRWPSGGSGNTDSLTTHLRVACSRARSAHTCGTFRKSRPSSLFPLSSPPVLFGCGLESVPTPTRALGRSARTHKHLSLVLILLDLRSIRVRNCALPPSKNSHLLGSRIPVSWGSSPFCPLPSSCRFSLRLLRT